MYCKSLERDSQELPTFQEWILSSGSAVMGHLKNSKDKCSANCMPYAQKFQISCQLIFQFAFPGATMLMAIFLGFGYIARELIVDPGLTYVQPLPIFSPPPSNATECSLLSQSSSNALLNQMLVENMTMVAMRTTQRFRTPGLCGDVTPSI